MILALVAIGGAAGAVARYALSGWVYRRVGARFPWGTLVVNVLGSFALGVVLALPGGSPWRPELVALFAVGFLGDFTTFSTMAYEATMQARDREHGLAAVYLATSTVAALVALAAGLWLGTRFV